MDVIVYILIFFPSTHFLEHCYLSKHAGCYVFNSVICSWGRLWFTCSHTYILILLLNSHPTTLLTQDLNVILNFNFKMQHLFHHTIQDRNVTISAAFTLETLHRICTQKNSVLHAEPLLQRLVMHLLIF